MKTLLIILVLTLLASNSYAVSDFNSTVKPTDFKTISNILDHNPESIVFVDTRGPLEREVSVIHPNAMAIEDFEYIIDIEPELIKGKKIVTYCTLGGRSKDAAKEIKILTTQLAEDDRPEGIYYYSGVYDWAINGGSFYISESENTTPNVHIFSNQFVNEDMQQKIRDNGYLPVE